VRELNELGKMKVRTNLEFLDAETLGVFQNLDAPPSGTMPATGRYTRKWGS